MIKQKITKVDFLNDVANISELEFARFLLSQEMGATYVSVGQLEAQFISAMLIAKKISVPIRKIDTSDATKHFIKKLTLLRESTLGSIIKILEKNEVNKIDIDYLKWIKSKRDYFIHSFLHDGNWPGELNTERCYIVIRKLRAMQHIFYRAENRLLKIMESNNFIKIEIIDEDNFLLCDPDFFDDQSS